MDSTSAFVCSVFEPWRGSDEYTWISFALVPFLFLQTSGCAAAAPLPLAAGAADPPGAGEQAAKTNTALAAIAPTLVSFMHSPPDVRSSGGSGTTFGRESSPPSPDPEMRRSSDALGARLRSTVPSQGVDRASKRCVTDSDAGPCSGGAQVTAETMPYHSHRRTECNTGRPHPRHAPRACREPHARRRQGPQA